MEERNFDFNSLIGIMLIGILLMFWISSNTQIETTISENENIKSDSIEITDKQNKNFVVEGKTFPFFIDQRYSIDVDEPVDLKIAELILKTVK